jgi:hypothetical protein
MYMRLVLRLFATLPGYGLFSIVEKRIGYVLIASPLKLLSGRKIQLHMKIFRAIMNEHHIC